MALCPHCNGLYHGLFNEMYLTYTTCYINEASTNGFAVITALFVSMVTLPADSAPGDV